MIENKAGGGGKENRDKKDLRDYKWQLQLEY